MARRDARTLRDAASAAAAEGKHRKALECYLELERLEPADPSWPKRAAETYRRLGKNREALAAYDRTVDRFVQSGFLVQAIAVCKVILQLDPQHEATKQRLATITSSRTPPAPRPARSSAPPRDHPSADAAAAAADPAAAAGPGGLAPGRARRSAAAAGAAGHRAAAGPVGPGDRRERGAGGGPGHRADLAHRSGAAARPPPPPPLDDDFSLDDALSVERVNLGLEPEPHTAKRKPISGPIHLDPGAPLDSVTLAGVSGVVPARRADGGSSGILVIPIDDEPPGEPGDGDGDGLGDGDDDVLVPSVEIEAVTVPREQEGDLELSIEPAEEPVELAVEDLEDLAEPRPYSAAAQRALEATPLFAGLPAAALEQLIDHLGLVELEVGDILFQQGDPGDALYVVAEGAVAVISEGPPRRQLSTLGPGAFFGEIALVTEQPRSATVVAETPCHLLAIDRAAIRALVGQFPDVLPVLLRFLRERLVDRLAQTHPLFASFSAADREYLVGQFRFLEIEAGTPIVREGGRPAGLYALLSGRVEVSAGGQRLRELGPGELFGERALLTGEPSQVSITAGGRCLALCMPSSVFREIIMTHPQVLSYVGELVDERERAGARLP
ncbi:MAG: cyclic nucleotide-binding domain-containing protein [Kofleriaceae bacterium]|nr:cyclic nucleotide-binding domain-containing protein [Kofleriaceae bacterium]